MFFSGKKVSPVVNREPFAHCIWDRICPHTRYSIMVVQITSQTILDIWDT